VKKSGRRSEEMVRGKKATYVVPSAAFEKGVSFSKVFDFQI
jgi:hypothetical protein